MHLAYCHKNNYMHSFLLFISLQIWCLDPEFSVGWTLMSPEKYCVLRLQVGDCQHFSVTFEGEREEHCLLYKCQTYELKAFYEDKRDLFVLTLNQENSFATLHWWLPENKRSLRFVMLCI